MKLLGMAILPLMLIGCCDKEKVYIDRPIEVKVPVPCKIEEVKPAKKGVNDADTLVDIVRELDELRAANKKCR